MVKLSSPKRISFSGALRGEAHFRESVGNGAGSFDRLLALLGNENQQGVLLENQGVYQYAFTGFSQDVRLDWHRENDHRCVSRRAK